MRYEEQDKKFDAFFEEGDAVGFEELDSPVVFVAHSRGYIRTADGARYPFMISHSGDWVARRDLKF